MQTGSYFFFGFIYFAGKRSGFSLQKYVFYGILGARSVLRSLLQANSLYSHISEGKNSMNLKNEILRLLAENGRLNNAAIAERLDTAEQSVQQAVAELEADGVIVGYRAMFDETLLPETAVKAIIEVKTKPERNSGFDRIAKNISKFSKVESVYLVSGSYDLLIEVRGDSLKDVAEFVSGKLATIDGVISTSTQFLLKKYKELGKMMQNEEHKERLNITP